MLLIYVWACVLAMFHIIFIVQSSNYRMLYGNDPLAPYPLVNDTTTTGANAAGKIARNAHMNNLIIKRANAVVETIFSVPEYGPDYYRKNDHWTSNKKQQQPYQQTVAVTKSIQLPTNTFTNQFHELQYRNVRNNYLKHRGYGYY